MPDPTTASPDVPAVQEVVSTASAVLQKQPSRPSRSTLGGGAAILDKIGDIGKQAEGRKDEQSSTLPTEKQVDLPAQPEKKGSDNRTASERAEFLAQQKTEKSRIMELEQKVADFDSTKKERDELKSLIEKHEQRIKELEPAAYMTDIRLDGHYNKSFGEPMKKLDAYLEKVIEKFKIPKQSLTEAIWNEDRFAGNAALSELLSTMDATSASEAQANISKYRELYASEQDYLKNPVEAWTALKEQEKKDRAAQKSKFSETYKLANEAVLKAMQERFTFMKDDKVAGEIMEGAVAVDFDELDAGAKAYYAQAGVVMRTVNSILSGKDKRIQELETALSKYTKQTSPSSGTPSSDASKTTAAAGSKPSEFLKSVGFGFR